MTMHRPENDGLGTAIRAAAADVRAPEALRARIDAQRAASGGGLPVLALLGAVGVLVTAGLIVLAIGLIGGSNRVEGPTMARAADAALRVAGEPAPAEDEAHPVLVHAGIAGLRFPYWDDEFGLDATAMRHDVVGGRRAMTVEYRGAGHRVGYTIVAGAPVQVPSDARWVRHGKLPVAIFRRDGATVVTWERAGHTCVIASRDAPARRLVALAAWTGGGHVGGYGSG